MIQATCKAARWISRLLSSINAATAEVEPTPRFLACFGQGQRTMANFERGPGGTSDTWYKPEYGPRF